MWIMEIPKNFKMKKSIEEKGSVKESLGWAFTALKKGQAAQWLGKLYTHDSISENKIHSNA